MANVKKRYEKNFKWNAQSALTKFQKDFKALDQNVTRTLKVAFNLKESFTNGMSDSAQ